MSILSEIADNVACTDDGNPSFSHPTRGCGYSSAAIRLSNSTSASGGPDIGTAFETRDCLERRQLVG
ncbi:hypothetical protein D8S78_17405 [Natrialba swarupiae]|nr:hypothetical protein [Natrialba swarupiae]